MAIIISFFNNKGGVGKTTTSCNIAAGLSQKFDKHVLIIDLDPQCNSTLLIEGEEKVSQYYWNDEDKTPSILTIVDPLLIDEPSINFEKTFIINSGNRFGVDVILGHPKLSMIEDRLGEAWGKVAGGDIGSLRKTNWCFSLLENLRHDYDYILIDLGPSLGSLNRSALIASDYFVTPMAIDIFSLIGLRNISEWLDEWTTKYERGIQNINSSPQDQKYLAQFPICTDLKIKRGFVGYTTQTYISKKKSGVSRPIAAFEEIYQNFHDNFNQFLGKYTKTGLLKENLVLGEIPNMYSLAPLSQSNSTPIRGLTAADGIFGAHYSQVEKYKQIYDSIAEKIIGNTGEAA